MRKALFILLAIVAVAVLAVPGLSRRWAPATRLQIKLDLLRSFEGHNTAVFTLAPQGAATTVTGSMTGPMPFVSKLMSVFVSMDRLIGEDFEAGLAKMKVAAEKPGA